MSDTIDPEMLASLLDELGSLRAKVESQEQRIARLENAVRSQAIRGEGRRREA
jgi:ubiquinone biosynthesis protein UbiJ